MSPTISTNPLAKPPAPSSSVWQLNHRILVSDAQYLEPMGINAYEDKGDQPDTAASLGEHQTALAAYKAAGIQVEQVPSPEGCQDGVFTANWGLTWNGRALLSRLPNLRQCEEPYAQESLQQLGFKTRRASVLFSGQGDAMIISGNRVLIGDGYRSNAAVAPEIRDWLRLEPIVVRTKPKRNWLGRPVKNKVTGLWDSYYYDLDLAVAVIRPDLIAVCFDALTTEGQTAIRSLQNVEIITVSGHEAKNGLACNLVSTGETVIMSNQAPHLETTLKSRDIQVVTLPNHHLRKSGGSFRCISLSLY